MKILKTVGTAVTLILFGLAFGIASIIAQTTPPALTVSGPSVTVDPKTFTSQQRVTLTKDYEKNVDLSDKITVAELRTERDSLKTEVTTLKGQLEEMKRAIALVQQQRNSALASMSDVQAQLQITSEALDAAKKASPASTPQPPAEPAKK